MPTYTPQPWSPDRLLERRRQARLARYEPLLLIAAAAAAGVVADRLTPLREGWIALAGVAWLGWLWAHRAGRSAASAVALLGCVAAVAGSWHDCSWRRFAGDDLGRFARPDAQPVCVEAIALATPTRLAAPAPSPYRAIPGGEGSRVEVEVVALRDGARWRPASGRTLLTAEGHVLGVAAGDRVRIFGQLTAPQPALNPGEFDYSLDQRAQRRLSVLRCESPDCVSVARRAPAVSVAGWLDRARGWAERTLTRELGPRPGALAAAMIVGSQDGLPDETVERFRRAGTLHVLVVSGLHVGLVVSAFYFFGRMGWAPRRWSLALIMVAIVAYALIAGARPPVVRAAVLAELMCLALWSGRTVLAMNSLGAAAIVVLAMNPAELFRTGSQLSFLAAGTLIWFGNRELQKHENLDAMTRLLRSVEPVPRKLLRAATAYCWVIFVATVAVWLTAAPLMMRQYHLVAPVAMPLAVAVFPLVSASVISGLAVLVAEVAMPLLAPACAWVSATCCGLLDRSISLAHAAPLGHFFVPGPALWWTLAAYALMFAAMRWGGRPRAARAITYAALLLVIAGFAPAMATVLRGGRQPGELRCTFIAVGHGVSVLIEPPEGGAFLYDAGSLGSPDAATERIAAVLWSRGVTRIDGVFLSHADVDHFDALPGLLDRFSIGGVYTTNVLFPRELLPDENTAPAALWRLLEDRRVPVTRLRLGDQIRLGGAFVEVLHPTALGVVDTDNANSLVLGLDHAGRRVLLTGDLEGRGLEEVLRQEPYDCDVLLAPHHGSARSDPPGLAAWCRPEHVVVSAAPGDDAAQAIAGYGASGAEVASTAERGAVTFVLGEERVSVEPFLSQ